MRILFLSLMMFFMVGALIQVPQVYGGSQTKDHPGKDVREHPGDEERVKADDVRSAIESYVDASVMEGHMVVKDDVLKKDWKLKFSKYHPTVTHIKDEDAYFICTDFVTMDNKTTLDLDFWVRQKDGALKVSEVKIHKVDGKERFVYEGDKLVKLD